MSKPRSACSLRTWFPSSRGIPPPFRRTCAGFNQGYRTYPSRDREEAILFDSDKSIHQSCRRLIQKPSHPSSMVRGDLRGILLRVVLLLENRAHRLRLIVARHHEDRMLGRQQRARQQGHAPLVKFLDIYGRRDAFAIVDQGPDRTSV